MIEMTDVVRRYIDEVVNQNILEADEYIDPEDGLIHCGVCHERRQTVVKRFRHPGYFIPRCPCSCQIEEERQRKEQQAQRERMERIKRRRAHGLRDKSLYVVSNKNGKSLIGMLTQLINNSGISICMVGTPKSTEFFEQAMQLARRSLGLQYGRMEFDQYFYDFCRTLYPYQYVSKRTAITPAIVEWLYAHSAGVISVVVSLIHDAQEIAIIKTGESWPGLFEGSYEHYDANGRYAGYSDPGIIADLVHHNEHSVYIGETHTGLLGEKKHYSADHGYVGESWEGLMSATTVLTDDCDFPDTDSFFGGDDW